jgi:large subunit ribosomal protein L33
MGKAKRASIFIRLVSAAGTGFFYVKRKNPRRITEKLEFRKYDPRVNKHVLFTEAKMKREQSFFGAQTSVPFTLV